MLFVGGPLLGEDQGASHSLSLSLSLSPRRNDNEGVRDLNGGVGGGGGAWRAKFASLKIDTTPPVSPHVAPVASASASPKQEAVRPAAASPTLASRSPKRGKAASPKRKSAPSPRVLAAASASASRLNRAFSPARRALGHVARVFGA
jgi:hypothetical protein